MSRSFTARRAIRFTRWAAGLSCSSAPPGPDATDPQTGQRYTDVIMFWVPSESDKQALVQDENSPFFTTPHFDGHPSVLVRACRISELTLQELTEIVHDAWLARASPARAAAWLSARRSG